MPRQILTEQSGSPVVRRESEVSAEEEPQRLVRDHPELLPAEEFGLSDPLLVVGRETQVASGAVDLLLLDPSGERVVVEFKTGRGNSDFKASLAQVLHYGSQLWERRFDDFERDVAVRYYTSDHCRDTRFRGSTSVAGTAQIS